MKPIKIIKLDLSFDDISSMSKSLFTKLVKQSCPVAAFQFLINEEEKKLSKGSEIHYDNLQTQKYLTPGNSITVHAMRTIFQIRVRNLPLKSNFPSQFTDTKCIITQCNDNDSQDHLYICKYIAKSGSIMRTDVDYCDMFCDNVQKQTEVMNILMTKMKIRNDLLFGGAPVDTETTTLGSEEQE